MCIFCLNSYTSSDTWIDWIIWTRSRTKHLSWSINSLLGLWSLNYSVCVERFERWTRFSIYWTQKEDISNYKISCVSAQPTRSISDFYPSIFRFPPYLFVSFPLPDIACPTESWRAAFFIWLFVMGSKQLQ